MAVWQLTSHADLPNWRSCVEREIKESIRRADYCLSYNYSRTRGAAILFKFENSEKSVFLEWMYALFEKSTTYAPLKQLIYYTEKNGW